MKKVKNLWHRVPRKAQVGIFTGLILLLILVFYICIGSPAFGVIHRFRRAEKAQWIGPSTILGTVELDGVNYDRLLLAEDDLGVYMYLYQEDPKYGSLHYREKAGDLTVLAVPQHAVQFGVDRISLPIIAFDDCPEAVRAALEVTVTASSTVVYTAEATRENDGFFCFRIEQSGWYNQINALCVLSDTGDSRYGAGTHTPFPGFIRLYDAAGQLIREESFFFLSPTMEANNAEKEAQP